MNNGVRSSGLSNDGPINGIGDRFNAANQFANVEVARDVKAFYHRPQFNRKWIWLDEWDKKFDSKRYLCNLRWRVCVSGGISADSLRVSVTNSNQQILLLRDQAKEWYWIFIRSNRNADWNVEVKGTFLPLL